MKMEKKQLRKRREKWERNEIKEGRTMNRDEKDTNKLKERKNNK
jgi:hypothetical protein